MNGFIGCEMATHESQGMYILSKGNGSNPFSEMVKFSIQAVLSNCLCMEVGLGLGSGGGSQRERAASRVSLGYLKWDLCTFDQG